MECLQEAMTALVHTDMPSGSPKPVRQKKKLKSFTQSQGEKSQGYFKGEEGRGGDGVTVVSSWGGQTSFVTWLVFAKIAAE